MFKVVTECFKSIWLYQSNTFVRFCFVLLKFKEIGYVVSILGKTPLKLLLAVRDIKMDQGQSQWARLVPGGVELASIYHFMHSLSEF